MDKIISILIPVFNEVFYTKECLKNLYESISYCKENAVSRFEIKIILIDDGSTDGTSEWVADNYPEVIILKGDGQLFWSGAVNMGIEYSMKLENISHILFWNKDLYVEKDYIILLQNHVLQSDNNVIISSKMFRKNTPNILFSYGGMYNSKTGVKKNLGAGQIDDGSFGSVKKIDWCGGMGVIIPVSVFSEIGFCDAVNFPQYDGDVDFFLRAKAAKFNLYVYPNLKIWNIHENTGRKDTYSFKNFLWILSDIRSYRNIKISYKFLKKHSIGFLPYFNFVYYYLGFSIKYLINIFISYFK